MNQRVWRAVSPVLVAGFAVLSAACAGAPINKPIEGGPVEIGAGTVTNARKFLEGTWTLISYDVYPPNQPALHLDATGYLAYDDFGNMTIELRTSPETAQAVAKLGMPAPQNGVISTTGKTIL